MLASITFVIGGVLGAMYRTWFGLLPGFILQIIALIVFSQN
jgi:hypothetical protein